MFVIKSDHLSISFYTFTMIKQSSMIKCDRNATESFGFPNAVMPVAWKLFQSGIKKERKKKDWSARIPGQNESQLYLCTAQCSTHLEQLLLVFTLVIQSKLSLEAPNFVFSIEYNA